MINIYYKRMKIFAIVFIVILLITGCRKNKMGYTGEYPELYSIAINSLLGTTGYGQSERQFSPPVKIIEEDIYGRKLFLYCENKSISTYSLIISQKSDDKYVYYYPDYNFISIPSESEVIDESLKVTTEKDFPVEAIEELKKNNDWGIKVNLDKCVKVKIVRKKVQGPVRQETLRQVYDKTLGEDAYDAKSSTYFFTSDEYGRSIYLASGKYSSKRHIVMLFQPDDTYDESKCIMELSDTQNYQDELKQFKEMNDWNQPLPKD